MPVQATMAAVLLGMAFVLPGCAAPPAPWQSGPTAWTPLPCDPNPTDHVSGNAPTLAAFTGTNETLGARFAAAVRDTITGPFHPSEKNAPPGFPSGHGQIFVGAVDGEGGNVTAWLGQFYRSPDLPQGWPGREFTPRAALSYLALVEDRLGIPPNARPVAVAIPEGNASSPWHMELRQPFAPGRNGTLEGFAGTVDGAFGALPTGQSGYRFDFGLAPLSDLSHAKVTVSESQALATVGRAAQCLVGLAGLAPQAINQTQLAVEAHGFILHRENLAYNLLASIRSSGTCTPFTVHVDAETGALLTDLKRDFGPRADCKAQS